MRVYEVAKDLDINTAASQSAIATIDLDNPFHPGAGVVAVIDVTAPPGTSVVLEGREDSSGSYTALATVLAADDHGTFMFNVTLTQEIRVTVNGTAGAGETANVYLLGN